MILLIELLQREATDVVVCVVGVSEMNPKQHCFKTLYCQNSRQ